MDEDDAAEMAALRQSSRYQRRTQRPQPTGRPQHSDDDEDDHYTATPRDTAQRCREESKQKEESTQESEEQEVDEDDAAMRAFLPAAFGASKASSKAKPAAATNTHTLHRRAQAMNDVDSATATTSAQQQSPDGPMAVKREEDNSPSPAQPSALDAFSLPLAH